MGWFSKSEAPKQAPDSKPESGERLKKAPEAEKKAEQREVSAGERFTHDAEKYMALRDSYATKSAEMKQLKTSVLSSKEKVGAANTLDDERTMLKKQMQELMDGYGAGATQFVQDAFARRNAVLDAEKAQKNLLDLEHMTPDEFPGGKQEMDATRRQHQAALRNVDRKLDALEGMYNAKQKAEKPPMTVEQINDFLDQGVAKKGPFSGERLSDEDIEAGLSELNAAIEGPAIETSDASAADAAEVAAAVDGENDATLEVSEMSPVDAAEFRQMIENDEISAERRAMFEGEIAALESRREELMEGSKDMPGLTQLEKDLNEKYGMDTHAFDNAKDADAMLEVLKKQSSLKHRLKTGLKALFSSGYRKTMEAYERSAAELDIVNDEIAMKKMAIEDPKRYADATYRRAMGRIMRGAGNSTSGSPKTMSV